MAEAGRIANLKNLMANGKSRNVLLATGVLVVIGVFLVKIGMGNKNERLPEVSGASIQPPPTMKATPSGSDITSKKYADLLAQSNQDNAQQAEATGKSSIPVPGNLKSDKPADPNKLGNQNMYVNPVQQQPVVTPPPTPREIPAGVKAQLDGLMERWTPQPQSITSTGYAKEKPVQSATSAQTAASMPSTAAVQADQSGKVLVQASTVLYGELDTAINTDEPGPVLATIVSGALKNSKLLGDIKRESGKVVLKFSTIATGGKTLQTNAYAIDPETARTALASDVDNHYWERYGLLAASALFKGYGAALQRSGSTVTATVAGTTTNYTDFDPQRQFVTALGEVGSAVGQATQGNFNRPPTVTVDAKKPIGILFMTDLVLK